MSIEKRQAKSLKMKIVLMAVKKMFANMSMGNNMDMEKLKKAREFLKKAEEKRKKNPNVICTVRDIDGARAEVTEPKEKKSDNIIIFLHGGAFVLSMFSYERTYVETLADRLGCTVYAVDYSVSPESKYPVALDECERVYKALKNENPNSKICIMGLSAGGNLAVALTLRLKAKKIKMPSMVVLHSPVIDLSGEIDRSINADINNDMIVKYTGKKQSFGIYVGDADAKQYDISPYYGDFNGFPPTFITCESHETLFADAVALDGLIERVGVHVKTVELDGAFHAYGALGERTPETKTILNECVNFINENF